MSKSHRDNHRARKKRGSVAFEKKAMRRAFVPRCNLCGTECRASVLVDRICPVCRTKILSK